MILCKLFENFLTFYDLDYSENVFKHEVNDQTEGDEILTKIGIDIREKSAPYIYQLFKEPRKSQFLKQKNPLEEKIDEIPMPKQDKEKKEAQLK